MKTSGTNEQTTGAIKCTAEKNCSTCSIVLYMQYATQQTKNARFTTNKLQYIKSYSCDKMYTQFNSWLNQMQRIAQLTAQCTAGIKCTQFTAKQAVI